MIGPYDIAQICLNGHTITSYYRDMPENRSRYCERCGSETITHCSHCESPIHGSRLEDFSTAPYVPPKFCRECGEPYPWTETRLSAATELAGIQRSLSDEERAILTQAIGEIVRDTPKTSLAAARFKQLILKAGSSAAAEFRELLVEIASETARKLIWPGP